MFKMFRLGWIYTRNACTHVQYTMTWFIQSQVIILVITSSSPHQGALRFPWLEPTLWILFVFLIWSLFLYSHFWFWFLHFENSEKLSGPGCYPITIQFQGPSNGFPSKRPKSKSPRAQRVNRVNLNKLRVQGPWEPDGSNPLSEDAQTGLWCDKAIYFKTCHLVTSPGALLARTLVHHVERVKT